MKCLKSTYRLVAICLLTCSVSASAQTYDSMIAHYIDVGQGQAILLEFPKGAVLIDAGGQPDKKDNVVRFLSQFFARRTDLQRTLDEVIITHQHIDHDQALKDVARTFKILNYVDNGHHNPHGSGQQQRWMQKHIDSLHVRYEPVTYDRVVAGNNHLGLTDPVIDPVNGSPTDPKIIIYSGAFGTGEVSDETNENVHSLVVKIIFGRASFLFMGDLEDAGIDKLLKYYKLTPAALDADVLQVGHHGSYNATTADWVRAVSPHYAVINVGQWNYGRRDDSTSIKNTTYRFGHPNTKAIKILQDNITDLRPAPIRVHIGVKGSANDTARPVFQMETITRNIYTTAWNGNIAITATAGGQYSVITDH